MLAQCQDYNERARELKLIPSTAENAAGVDYELKCHLGKMNLDVNNHLKVCGKKEFFPYLEINIFS